MVMARGAGCLLRLLLGVLLFSPAPAWAVPAPMSPDDLMAASDLVALVRVLAVTCVGVFKDGHTGENLPSYQQQFSFWWTGVRPKGHTGLEKDWAAILGRLGLIQGRDGGARQPAERRAALL